MRASVMAFVTVWFKTITEPHPQKRQEIPFTYLNCTDNYDVIEIINIYLQIAKLFFCGGSLDYILFNLLTTVYTCVQVERVYKSNPIFEAKNTTFLEKV